MGINYRNSIRIFGVIMIITGLSMLLPAAIGIIYGEFSCARTFVAIALPSAAVGFILMRFIKGNNKTLKMRDGAFIVSISWIIASILGAVPFIATGSMDSIADAFFESASGFTTTGATVYTDVESVPHALLFWRALSHWIGGMGILVFTIAILPSIGMNGQQIASAEMTGPSLAKIVPRLSDTARYLYTLYFAMTAFETMLLMLGGMNLFDAVCHSFSTLGTGGFGNYNDSVAHFGSFYIDIVITVFMTLAGINFNLFFLVFKNGIREFFKDGEWKLYLGIIIFVSIVSAFVLIISDTFNTTDALRHSFFQSVSAITTTGFTSTNFMLWPVFCQSLLFLLFFIGGSSSSTSGGIKVIRILVFAKMVKRSLILRLHPNAVVPIKVNDRHVSGDTVSHMSGFLFLYICVGMGCAFILSLDGFDVITNISTAFSCLGNIGFSISTVTFAEFSGLSKIIMSFVMIAGRLELFTLLALVTRKFWKPYQ